MVHIIILQKYVSCRNEISKYLSVIKCFNCISLYNVIYYIIGTGYTFYPISIYCNTLYSLYIILYVSNMIYCIRYNKYNVRSIYEYMYVKLFHPIDSCNGMKYASSYMYIIQAIMSCCRRYLLTFETHHTARHIRDTFEYIIHMHV